MVAGTNMKRERKEHSDLARGLALLAWIAWEIVGLTAAGIALGWALTRWWGLPQILSALFGLAGLIAAFFRIHRAVRAWEKPRE